MNTHRKLWLVLAGIVLAMTVIACMSSATPASTPRSSGNQEAMPGLAGRGNDPDTTGTVTTIAWQNGTYVVISVTNPNRGGNEVTKSSWLKGVLTWTYCIPDGNCITSITVSVSGDNLDTTWTDDTGQSGTTTFNRVP